MVNHVMNNEMAIIIWLLHIMLVRSTHTTINKMAKITDTIFIWHVHWTPSTMQTKQIKNYALMWKDARIHD